MIVESAMILYALGKRDILERDVSGPREFFDRLCATKELAHECQGKVEISFSGYDDDPRELYEIEEVREYVRVLSPVLPELFFFARTEEPTGTLLTFSLCQTAVLLKDEPSNHATMRKVEFETYKVAEFFKRHCYGLNKMTKWLNISEEENKRISFDVIRSLGFDFPRDTT